MENSIQILTSILQNLSRPTAVNPSTFLPENRNLYQPSYVPKTTKSGYPANIFKSSPIQSAQRPHNSGVSSSGNSKVTSGYSPTNPPLIHPPPSLVPMSTAASHYTASCLALPTTASPVSVLVSSPTTPVTTRNSSIHSSPAYNLQQASSPSSPLAGTPPLTPSKMACRDNANKDSLVYSGPGIVGSVLPAHGVVKNILNSRPRGRGRGRGRIPGGLVEGPHGYGGVGLHSESPMVEDITATVPRVESWDDGESHSHSVSLILFVRYIINIQPFRVEYRYILHLR